MTIIRDGKEIELTFEEMREAYEHIEIVNHMSDFLELFDVEIDSPILEEAVNRFESYLMDCDPYFEAYWDCMWTVAEELGLKEIEPEEVDTETASEEKVEADK